MELIFQKFKVFKKKKKVLKTENKSLKKQQKKTSFPHCCLQIYCGLNLDCQCLMAYQTSWVILCQSHHCKRTAVIAGVIKGFMPFSRISLKMNIIAQLQFGITQ